MHGLGVFCVAVRRCATSRNLVCCHIFSDGRHFFIKRAPKSKILMVVLGLSFSIRQFSRKKKSPMSRTHGKEEPKTQEDRSYRATLYVKRPFFSPSLSSTLVQGRRRGGEGGAVWCGAEREAVGTVGRTTHPRHHPISFSSPLISSPPPGLYLYCRLSEDFIHCSGRDPRSQAKACARRTRSRQHLSVP